MTKEKGVQQVVESNEPLVDIHTTTTASLASPTTPSLAFPQRLRHMCET